MTFRLDNGLEVVLEENHAAPVVAFQAWVNVGSADEPPELAGIAHVFEHMLFKGTARSAASARSRRRSSRPAARSTPGPASTRPSTTWCSPAASSTPASTSWPTRCQLVASIPASSSASCKVVLEEVKQGEDNPEPRRHAVAVLRRPSTRHPYRRPVIGYEQHGRAARARAICSTSSASYYVPHNITLVVVGDFDAAGRARRSPPPSRGMRRRRAAAQRAPCSRAQRRACASVASSRDVKETQLALRLPHARPSTTPTSPRSISLAIVLGQGD